MDRPLADQDWRLIPEESRTGPMNMALDIVAARSAASGGPRTIRVYRWDPSTLSLGYSNKPEDINWEFCNQEGIDVIRRPTGGGAIYHDYEGDISYSIIAPAEDLPSELLDAYHICCAPIRRLDIEAAYANDAKPAIHEPTCYLRDLHPAHDILVDQCKISGNAQYRQRDSVIQHGSISFDLHPRQHLNCFDNPPKIEEFTNRVTSIRGECGADRSVAVSTLETT
ncbi:MAG: biotin/lipoate A/B protein ligase family protein, partial [Halobacteriaceae archaeon]